MGIIQWGTEQIALQADVVRDSTRRFTRYSKGCGRRTVAPRLMGVHWTGAERPPERSFERLSEVGLAAEFGMAYDGTLHQWANPTETFCAHMQGCNTISFGIEVQCRGPMVKTLEQTPPFSTWDAAGFKREAYHTTIRGRPVRCANFSPAQLETLLELTMALIERKIIAPTLLGNAAGDDLFMGTITRAQRVTLLPKVGIVGHYQVDEDKIDCGPAPLKYLQELADLTYVPVP